MTKLDIDAIDKKNIDWLVASITNIGAPCRVYVLQGPPKRSIPLMRYYFGVVVWTVTERTGYEKEDIHAFNKKHFGDVTIVEIGGEKIERVHGLRQPRDKAKRFVDKVIQHWEEQLGEHIPAPNEMTEGQIIEAMERSE